MVSRLSARTLALGALLFALGASGCGFEDRSADARLFWTFAGKGCRATGVSMVQVTMDPIDGGTWVDSGLVPCTDGSVELYDLDRGWYRVRVLGFRPSGGYATWDADVDVRLYEGYNEATIDLVPSGSW